MSIRIPGPEKLPSVEPSEKEAYVRRWIEQRSARAAVGVGVAMALAPLAAEGQAAPLVDVASINGVTSAQVLADGSLQLTLANGSVAQVAASAVTVAADGSILISAAAAQTVAQAAAVGALGAGAGAIGAGLAGLSGLAAAAGATDGGGTGGGGGGPADPAPVPPPVVPPAPPPAVAPTITSPVPGFLNAVTATQDLVVRGTATPGARVTVGVTGGATREVVAGPDSAWTATFAPAALPGTDGTVRITAQTVVGDTTLAAAPVALVRDTAPPAAPTIALTEDTGTLAGTTSNGEVTITGIEAGGRAEISLDGGATFAPVAGNKVTLSGDGAKSVIVRTFDAAGNPSPETPALDFILDTTPPPALVLTLAADTGSVAGQTANATVNVAGRAPGAVVEVSTDGGTTWTVLVGDSIDLSGADGPRSVIARQTDGAGNVSTTPAFAFVLDTTAPAAPVATLEADTGTAADGLTNNGQVNVAGLEPSALREFSLDGGVTWTAFDGASFTLSGDGAKSVLVRQTDGAGNVSAPSAPLAFTLDTTPPAPLTLSLSSDTGSVPGVTSDPLVNVLGREDGLVAEFSTDGGTTWTPFSGTSFSLAGPDGARSVIARQIDAAGNASAPSAALDFTLDTTPPATPTLSLEVDSGTPGDGLTNNGQVNVAGLEEGAGREYSLDGGATWTGFSGTSFGLTGDGARSVIVRQVDGAGNASGNSAALDIVLDTTPPVVTVTSFGGVTSGTITAADLVNTAGTAIGPVAIAGTTDAPDGTPIAVSFGGVALTATAASGAWTVDVSGATASSVLVGASNVSITASATDAAGNVGSATLGLAADVLLPTISVSNAPALADLGLAAFEGGFSVVAATQNVSNGQTATFSLVRVAGGAEVASTTGTVTGGSVTGVFSAAQVQALADVSAEAYRIDVRVSDPAFPLPATASATTTIDIPAQIEITPVGIDGALLLAGLGPTVAIGGTTTGVQAGRTVEVREASNAVVGTATVQADGTWSADVTLPAGFGSGVSVAATASVTSAGGRTATASESFTGYQPAAYMIAGGDALPSGALEFAVLLDPRTTLPADFGLAFGETMTFDPALAGFVVSPLPAYVAGITRVVNVSNAGTGQVVFGGIGFLDDRDAVPDPFDAELIRFRINDLAAGSVKAFEVTSQVGGKYASVLGTAGDDALAAQNFDTVLRGRGGNDTVNVGAPGAHTVIFEATEAQNGQDTIVGFDIGGALGDRIAFANLDQAELRGNGTQFEVISAGTAIGANTGLVVFTTALADNAGLTGALNALGLQGNDVIYVLAEGGGQTALVRVAVDAAGNLPAADDIDVLARFDGLRAADLAGFSQSTILGFDAVSLV